MILLMSPFISYIIHSGLVETDSIPSQHEEEFSPAQGLDSLVASWSFNEGSGTTLFDSTDNGNDGTISGATWTDGIVGGALEFDGEDDYIDFPASNSFKALTDEFTIQALIKLSSRGTQKGSTLLMMTADSSLPEVYTDNLLVVVPSEIQTDNKVRVAVLDASGHEEIYDFDHILPLNQWLLFTVLRKSNGTLSLYVNATYIESFSDTEPLRTELLQKVYLGTDIDTEPTRTDFFDGLMDEIRIYNYSVTETEIEQQYEELFSETMLDTSPPSIDHPADINYQEGDTGYSITWTVDDLNPQSYSISRNSTEIESGSWTNTMDTISISVDGLAPGTHIYELLIIDAFGNNASDSVSVVVSELITTTTTTVTTTTTTTSPPSTTTSISPTDVVDPMMIAGVTVGILGLVILALLFGVVLPRRRRTHKPDERKPPVEHPIEKPPKPPSLGIPREITSKHSTSLKLPASIAAESLTPRVIEQKVAPITKGPIQVASGFDAVGENLKLAVKVSNIGKLTITNVQVVLDVPDAFEFVKDTSKTQELGNIAGGEYQSAIFWLRPTRCIDGEYGGTILYRDAEGTRQIVEIPPKRLVNICPMLKSTERADEVFARLKSGSLTRNCTSFEFSGGVRAVLKMAESRLRNLTPVDYSEVEYEDGVYLGYSYYVGETKYGEYQFAAEIQVSGTPSGGVLTLSVYSDDERILSGFFVDVMHDVRQHIEIIEEKMCPVATCSKCGGNIDLSKVGPDRVYKCEYCGTMGKASPWLE